MHTLRLTALLSLLTVAAVGAPPSSQPTSPDAILAEIDALPKQDLDRSRAESDPAYLKAYEEQEHAVFARQAELELLFYRSYPQHPQAETILVRRWNNQLTEGAEPARISREVDGYLHDHPGGPTSDDAKQQFARLRGRLAKGDEHRLLKIAQEFATSNPRNEFGADLFLEAANAAGAPEAKDKLLRQIVTDYPNSHGATRAGGKLRQVSQLGMPFDLGFFNVNDGQWVHTRQMHGKVVVIDFWATWCGPCVGSIPHLQELYSKYKAAGLEIIGVSIDGPQYQTSLDTLKDFIAKHHVSWPQYYQGEDWDSSFSSSWGIEGIPTVFVVDQTGRLYSTDARGKLDEILAKLLPAGKK